MCARVVYKSIAQLLNLLIYVSSNPQSYECDTMHGVQTTTTNYISQGGLSLNPSIIISDCFLKRHGAAVDAASRINLRKLDNAIILRRQLRLITVAVSPLFCALYAAAGNRLCY